MPKNRTQPQKRLNAEILSWLRNPDDAPRKFSVREVLDNYGPPDLKDSGQYFTKPETARAALEQLRLCPPRSGKLRALDLCGGIGHLVYPFSFLRDLLDFDVYEIEEECVEVGRYLFPWANWFGDTPFKHISELEGKYDLVLVNPPIGTRRGIELARHVCERRSSRSEHLFLELAVRALNHKGQVVFLGPDSLLERRPMALRQWMDEQSLASSRFGPLPKPKGAPVALYAFYFKRPKSSKGNSSKSPPLKIQFDESNNPAASKLEKELLSYDSTNPFLCSTCATSPRYTRWHNGTAVRGRWGSDATQQCCA
ncbi:MAG: hypothetical protein BroJett011_42650 [Chloroflexota bacterium]|nr:MAG: hypothetical protein BroJett011_42650 [Chloroflexota bacterium]